MVPRANALKVYLASVLEKVRADLTRWAPRNQLQVTRARTTDDFHVVEYIGIGLSRRQLHHG